VRPRRERGRGSGPRPFFVGGARNDGMLKEKEGVSGVRKMKVR
jgi:hypothetical protein